MPCRDPKTWKAGTSPDRATLTSPENVLNHRNARAETALATGPALCKQAEKGFMPSLDICRATWPIVAVGAGVGLVTFAFGAGVREIGIRRSVISIGAIGAVSGPIS